MSNTIVLITYLSTNYLSGVDWELPAALGSQSMITSQIDNFNLILIVNLARADDAQSALYSNQKLV
jgi:hypothetical protein